MVVLLSGAVALALIGVGVWLAAPASRRSRRRDGARRLRRVAQHPERANSGDIARLLERAGLSCRESRAVVAAARRRGITPQTMWAWTQRFGGHGLRAAVGAGLSHRDLLEHLVLGTRPDLRELEVLAGLSLSGR